MDQGRTRENSLLGGGYSNSGKRRQWLKASGSSRNGKKRLDSDGILKVEPRVFIEESDLGQKREKLKILQRF